MGCVHCLKETKSLKIDKNDKNDWFIALKAFNWSIKVNKQVLLLCLLINVMIFSDPLKYSSPLKYFNMLQFITFSIFPYLKTKYTILVKISKITGWIAAKHSKIWKATRSLWLISEYVNNNITGPFYYWTHWHVVACQVKYLIIAVRCSFWVKVFNYFFPLNIDIMSSFAVYHYCSWATVFMTMSQHRFHHDNITSVIPYRMMQNLKPIAVFFVVLFASMKCLCFVRMTGEVNSVVVETQLCQRAPQTAGWWWRKRSPCCLEQCPENSLL